MTPKSKKRFFFPRFVSTLLAVSFTLGPFPAFALRLRREESSPRASALRPSLEGTKGGLEEAFKGFAIGLEEPAIVGKGWTDYGELNSRVSVARQIGRVTPLADVDPDFRELLLRVASDYPLSSFGRSFLERLEILVVNDAHLIQENSYAAGWVEYDPKRPFPAQTNRLYLNGLIWSQLSRSAKVGLLILTVTSLLEAKILSSHIEETRTPVSPQDFARHIRTLAKAVADRHRTSQEVEQAVNASRERIRSLVSLQREIQEIDLLALPLFDELLPILLSSWNTRDFKAAASSLEKYRRRNSEQARNYLWTLLKQVKGKPQMAGLVGSLTRIVSVSPEKEMETDSGVRLLGHADRLGKLFMEADEETPGISPSGRIAIQMGTNIASQKHSRFLQWADEYFESVAAVIGTVGVARVEEYLKKFASRTEQLRANDARVRQGEWNFLGWSFGCLMQALSLRSEAGDQVLEALGDSRLRAFWGDLESVDLRFLPVGYRSQVYRALAGHIGHVSRNKLASQGLGAFTQEQLAALHSPHLRQRITASVYLHALIRSDHPTQLPVLQQRLLANVLQEASPHVGAFSAVLLGELMRLGSSQDPFLINLDRHRELLHALRNQVPLEKDWLKAVAIAQTLRRLRTGDFSFPLEWSVDDPRGIQQQLEASQKRLGAMSDVGYIMQRESPKRIADLVASGRIDGEELALLQRIQCAAELSSIFGYLPGGDTMITGDVAPSEEALKRIVGTLAHLRTCHLEGRVSATILEKMRGASRSMPIPGLQRDSPLIDFTLSAERTSLIQINYFQGREAQGSRHKPNILFDHPKDIAWLAHWVPVREEELALATMTALPPGLRPQMALPGEGAAVGLAARTGATALTFQRPKEMSLEETRRASEELAVAKQKYFNQVRGTFSEARRLADQLEAAARVYWAAQAGESALAVSANASAIVKQYGRDQLEEIRKQGGFIEKRRQARDHVFQSISFERGFALVSDLLRGRYKVEVHSMKEINEYLPDLTCYDVALIGLLEKAPGLYFASFARSATFLDDPDRSHTVYTAQKFHVIGPLEMTPEGIVFSADDVTDYERQGGPRIEADPYHYLGIKGLREHDETVRFTPEVARSMGAWLLLSLSDKEIFWHLWDTQDEAPQRGRTLLEAAALQSTGGTVPSQEWIEQRLKSKRILDPVRKEELSVFQLVKLIGFLEYVPEVLLREQEFQGYLMPYGKHILFINGSDPSLVEAVPYAPYLRQRAEEELLKSISDISSENRLITRIWNILDQRIHEYAQSQIEKSEELVKRAGQVAGVLSQLGTELEVLRDLAGRDPLVKDASQIASRLRKTRRDTEQILQKSRDLVIDLVLEKEVSEQARELLRELLNGIEARQQIVADLDDQIIAALGKAKQRAQVAEAFERVGLVLKTMETWLSNSFEDIRQIQVRLDRVSRVDRAAQELSQHYGVELSHRILKRIGEDREGSSRWTSLTNQRVWAGHTMKIGADEAQVCLEAFQAFPGHLLRESRIRRIEKEAKNDRYDLTFLIFETDVLGKYQPAAGLLTLYGNSTDLVFKMYGPKERQMEMDTLVHEIGHDVWERLPEEARVEWSEFSWVKNEEGNWEPKEGSVLPPTKEDEKEGRTSRPSPDHFLDSYAASRPEEDFVEHQMLYLIHGDELRAKAQPGTVLGEKYRFLREHIFTWRDEAGVSRTIEPTQRTSITIEELEGRLRFLREHAEAERARVAQGLMERSIEWRDPVSKDQARDVARSLESMKGWDPESQAEEEGEFRYDKPTEDVEDTGGAEDLRDSDLIDAEKAAQREAYRELRELIEDLLAQYVGAAKTGSKGRRRSYRREQVDQLASMVEHVEFDEVRDRLTDEFNLSKEQAEEFVRTLLEHWVDEAQRFQFFIGRANIQRAFWARTTEGRPMTAGQGTAHLDTGKPEVPFWEEEQERSEQGPASQRSPQAPSLPPGHGQEDEEDAGLEEKSVAKALSTLTEASQGPGVVVLEADVLAKRAGLEELIRQLPPRLAKRIITFEGSDLNSLVGTLMSKEEADRITYIGLEENAKALAQILPPSMTVLHKDPTIGLEEIFLALGIPQEVLHQVDLSGLEEQLARSRAA